MSDFSKNRVLALYKILIKNSDEQHSISMQDILDHMACGEKIFVMSSYDISYLEKKGISELEYGEMLQKA